MLNQEIRFPKEEATKMLNQETGFPEKLDFRIGAQVMVCLSVLPSYEAYSRRIRQAV